MARQSLLDMAMEREAARRRRALRDPGGRGQPSAAGREQRAQFPVMPRVRFPVVMPYPAADRFLVVPNIVALGPGAVSQGYKIEFGQGAGTVLGLKGSAATQSDQALARSSLKFRITWNANEEIVTNGQSSDWARFSDVFTDDLPFAPLFVEVTREDRATVYFANDHPVNTYTPSVIFYFKTKER